MLLPQPAHLFKGIHMFEIWDGNVFLFCVDDSSEADIYTDQGFNVIAVTSF
jgi:hypothetical protein